tara:strand:+ start:224 stop:430 length:207 start_codon:yes stop_codon:yes gene_type:complete
MQIEIIKDIQDLREGFNRIIPKGRIFICTEEMGKKYLKTKCAKETTPRIRVIKPITNEADLEEYYEEN